MNEETITGGTKNENAVAEDIRQRYLGAVKKQLRGKCIGLKLYSRIKRSRDLAKKATSASFWLRFEKAITTDPWTILKGLEATRKAQ